MLYLINYSKRNAVLFHPFLMLIMCLFMLNPGMHLADFLQNEASFLLLLGRMVTSAKAARGKQAQRSLTAVLGS